MKPHEGFCDGEGFPIIGGRCALDICNAHDFLPTPCVWCGAGFCQEHGEPNQHDCKEVSKCVGVQAAICTHCEDTVRWSSAETTEADALEAHRRHCRGSPQEKVLCPVKGCQTVLGFTNWVLCQTCGQQVCMPHRFEDAHLCQPRIVPVEDLPAIPAGPNTLPVGASAAVNALPFQRADTATEVTPPLQVSAPVALEASVAEATETRPKLASPKELRELRKNLKGTTASRDACLSALRRLLSDVIRNPCRAELRSVSRESRELCQAILVVPGAEDLLLGIGYQDTGAAFVLPQSIAKGRIAVVVLILA